eukprot:9500470-Pyramimonas_sp.AAC.1
MLHTRESIREIQLHLRHLKATTTKGELEKAETLMGFAYNEDGLLQDDHLAIDLAVIGAWDWMHCYVVGGLWQREVTEFTTRLKDRNMGPKQIHQFLKGWEWPRGYASGRECFHAGHLSGSASQSISLAPALEQCVKDHVVPTGVCLAEAECCRALCRVLGMLSIVNSGLVSPTDLGVAIVEHLGRHRA